MKTTDSTTKKYGRKGGPVIRRYLAKIGNLNRQIAALKAQLAALKKRKS